MHLTGIWLAAAVMLSVALPLHAQNAATPAMTVTGVATRQEMWPDTVRATGAIEPWQEAVVSAQVGGQRVVEVLAEVGDSVRAGQVLARFDTATLRAEEAELAAAVQQAEASLAEAEANRERAMALKERNLMSGQDVTRMLTQADVARAQLAAAQARLASKRLQLKYTDIVAPDAGVVSARSATLGAVASVGQELFRLIRQGRLEWRGELTAQQLARVAIGSDVELALPNGERATARVRQLAPSMNSTSRLATVYADVPGGGSARAGMYAEGTLLLAKTEALVVPATSIVIRDGRNYVFVLPDQSASTRVVAQPVQTGRRMGDAVEIREGLAPGARVVQQGAGFLNDGDIVRVVP
ncbi:MAG TPA: efflux RND transporter periplasmic adaptor subunit [Gammaproteobacteria bacterium]|nr:efflux RND transporter periplasmic adaptor subunit [Gammaproteobacteria bacterium]